MELHLRMYCIAITAFMLFPLSINAFNLSPYPSLVINSPKDLNFQSEQTRSSYFGYTLVIRPTSIIVGAPRSQSTLASQRNINETGAIYRCSLEMDDCSPYIVDHQGQDILSKNTYKGRKDFQFLGGSMDGGTLDTDMLLVCAPRFSFSSIELEYMTGVCYRVENTIGKNPGRVTPIYRVSNKSISYASLMREMGFSAHVVEDNSIFLIGAPAKAYCGGSVFVHRSDMPLEGLFKEVQTKLPLNSDIFYFGYAVSSGHFDSANIQSLQYVITAPQANRPSGEAYILSSEGKFLRTLKGEQLGEYFGYSVLAEDLNGDKLMDLIVSAPMHGTNDTADNGAIYVFINKGLLNFEKKIVKSPLANSARFGTTLSRLGDINHDGFNDVAVSAPFAGNGSVFIYLGSEKGLQDVPSQQLDSPSDHPSKYGAHMFGHGLSRGSDIDGNGFNDLAIGAPNAEAVFLYRAYPVVKLYGTVRSNERRISPQQKILNITACYRLSMTAEKKEVQEQVLSIRIVADPRITFALTQTSEFNYRVAVGPTEQCRVLELQVAFTQKDVYKPIDLQMHYDVAPKDSVQEGGFCETCFAVDPTGPKSSMDRIVFNVGCDSAVCIADLQLNSKDLGSTFTLGSSDILRLTYEITNAGEIAYLPQFNVTSDACLTFAQVPGECQVSGAVMMCDLNGGNALGKGETYSITVSFDVSQLSGTSLIVTAEVFSIGYERNLKDNKHVTEINLREFTEIDVTGDQTSSQILLDNHDNSLKIIKNFEIKSHGPSAIEQLAVDFLIPIAYKAIESKPMIPIINVTSLKVVATHDSQPLVIELSDHDNKQKEKNPEDRSSETGRIRSSRDLGIPVHTSYDLLGGNSRGQLPLNRTIVFSCQDSEKTMCIRASLNGVRLKSDNSIFLNVSYHVNLNEVNAILLKPWGYFVILIDVEVAKKDDPTFTSLAINKRIEPCVISKNLKAIISIWIILPSVIAGLLIFSVINYSMYKVGLSY
ncbi:hypothetical protein KR200_004249 [Drosophila serrata]|nr:hypothetical protein KR200_004249 [Drosophila serrata]